MDARPTARFADAPPATADVVVIGGGVIGCATAFFAARAGLSDVELLTGDEARARWPWLAPEVRGARYRALDGWLDPKQLSVGYAVAASNATAIPDATPGRG